MKNVLPVAGSGAAAALLLYGFLWAIQPRLAPAPDLWLNGWRAAGLPVEPGVADPSAAKHLIFVDGRELFARPDLKDATVMRYLIQGVKVQVVRIPDGAELDEIEEGRHLMFRLREKGGAVHVCRRGKDLLFVSIKVNTPMMGDMRVSEKFVGRIFDAFEGTAGRAP